MAQYLSQQDGQASYSILEIHWREAMGPSIQESMAVREEQKTVALSLQLIWTSPLIPPTSISTASLRLGEFLYCCEFRSRVAS